MFLWANDKRFYFSLPLGISDIQQAFVRRVAHQRGGSCSGYENLPGHVGLHLQREAHQRAGRIRADPSLPGLHLIAG